jgi:putative transposase
MLSQEAGNVSPTEVTPELGEGALGTWQPSRPYGGRLDKTGTYAGYGLGGRGCGQTRIGRGVYEPAFQPLHPWEGLRMLCQGFKPDPGNLAVRHYRGASRNVCQGEIVTPPAIERAGTETPHLQRGALDFYPDQNHLNHATWECKYHVVFTPKYRKKLLFGQIRRHLGNVFRELAQRKECQIEEGHLMSDHVHMLISIPPKYSVSEVIGYLKGKSSIWIAQNVERKLRNFLGHKFWARGYFVSTIGRDEEMIRAYIRNQEMADKQLDQLQLKLPSS